MWSVWLVFCDCGFHSVCPLRDKDRGLWKLPDGRDWLWGLILMGRAMLSKSFIQVFVDEWACVLSLLFGLRSNYGRGNDSNGHLFQKDLFMHCCIQCPWPPAGRCRPTPLQETPGHSQASLAQSLVGTLLLSPGSWCTQGFVCALQESALVIPKHPLPTTQETTLHMDITKWSIPKSDWLYSLQPKMVKLYTIPKKKKKRLGADWLRSWTPYCQIQT